MFKIKKTLSRAGITIGTIGLIITGAAAFSAFEAHVINVTARIENALSVNAGDSDRLDFGTVFPQEYLTRDIKVVLSDSFVGEGRVDDVEYTIKQKPKVKEPTCIDVASAGSLFGLIKVAHAQQACDPNADPTPGDPYSVITVGSFTGPAWQYCEENLPPDDDETDNIGYTVDLTDPYWNYCYLPLANDLSKHELTTDGTELENDTSVDAFHQAYVWDTSGSSLDPQFVAKGRLVKSALDTEDSWQIDLKVPCFASQCAQEAGDKENELDDLIPGFFVPDDFRLDPATEHSVFGTDLWVEVTEISSCQGTEVSHDVVSDTTNTVEGDGNAVALSTINANWTASIPGATWIWSTDPVLEPTTVDTSATFNKTFTVTGPVASASLDIAVDNTYSVYVNGVLLGSELVNHNNFESGTQDSYVVTNLVPGLNTIKIVATNKGQPGSSAESNPAGVLYKLTYTQLEPCTED